LRREGAVGGAVEAEGELEVLGGAADVLAGRDDGAVLDGELHPGAVGIDVEGDWVEGGEAPPVAGAAALEADLVLTEEGELGILDDERAGVVDAEGAAVGAEVDLREVLEAGGFARD